MVFLPPLVRRTSDGRVVEDSEIVEKKNKVNQVAGTKDQVSVEVEAVNSVD